QLDPSPAATDLIVALNTTHKPAQADLNEITPRLLDLARSLHAEHDTYRESDPAVAKLAEEAASYLYLSATIVELFTEINHQQLIRITAPHAFPSLEDIAIARRALALDPHLSWVKTTAFRAEEGMQ
nr:hypothetical protein [Actinomycetota bacterium]